MQAPQKSAPRLLLVNTCAAEALVALGEGRRVISFEHLPGRGTAEHLMPAIERLLAAGNVSLRELDAIAVVNGPGSFTGVRVGLSAVKGLCEAAAIPLIAISRLALLASVSAHAAREGELLALLDAGRSEYYCGASQGRRSIVEQLLVAAEVRERLKHARGIVCEDLVASALGDCVERVREPGAEATLALALDMLTAGEWSDVVTLDANYLRRPDAELARMTNQTKAV